jgi:hypothetical protein
MKKLVVLVAAVSIAFVSFGQKLYVNTWIPDNKDCSTLFLSNQNFENNLSRFIIFSDSINQDELIREIQIFVNKRYNSIIGPEYSIEVLQVWFDTSGNVDVISIMILDNVALHPNNFELNNIPKSFKTDLRNIESSYLNGVLFNEIRTVFDIFNKK